MTNDLIRKDPIRSLFAWPRWMDEFDFSTSSQRGLRIHETDKELIAEAVVAGVPADKVDVDIENGVLRIRAETEKEEKTKEGEKKSSYSYYYTAALSGGRWDKASAEIEDGVVKITIPKEKKAKPRKIKVKAKEK
jgi:HSP20 family protein